MERLSIDNFMHSLEVVESSLAVFPVIGSLTGSVKIITGSLQIVTALFFILIVLVAPIKNKTELLNWSASHIVHGIANIVAGTIEAIPVIGTIQFFVRKGLADRQQEKDFTENKILNLYPNPYFTWIGYQSIAKDLGNVHKRSPAYSGGLIITL